MALFLSHVHPVGGGSVTAAAFGYKLKAAPANDM